MEQGTREILYEANAYEQLGMASTTKIMTAVVALEHANLSDVVTVGNNAAGVEGSSMWLEAGETITVENLLYGLMLNSGNDAAVALAEHVGGTVEQFCAMMNQKAKEIGANQTHFVNPNGLAEKGHYTTAYDLGLITCYALENEQFCEIVKTWERTIPWPGRDYEKRLVNHNKLLQLYEGCDGVKTGFTKSTGRALVSSATRDGMQVVAVTLNAPDDWNDHQAMLSNAFESYQTIRVIPENGYVQEVGVKGGIKETVGIASKKEISFVCERGETADYEIEIDVPKDIDAPVKRGESAGILRVLLHGERVAQGELYFNESVEEDEGKQFFIYIQKLLEIWTMRG
ncbi:MAG: D-alanyl-D-alanine carboxypeptidase [Ruminococcaceae bacterium]|nr:D-alanyl-D-alanine carboxypeptidase [Oscillospiraceae bacterium]